MSWLLKGDLNIAGQEDGETIVCPRSKESTYKNFLFV